MAKKKAVRKHRGLVLGHLERISSAAFDRYKQVITEMVGGRNGIYALYRNDRLYYVGLATDLKGRVNQHLKDRHKGKWTHFSLYLVRSDKHMKDLESLCLRIADPKGNKVRGKLAGAKDLRRAFKRKLLDQARAEVIAVMGDGDKPTDKPGKKRKSPKMLKAAQKAAETRRKKAAKNAPLKPFLKNKTLRATYKGQLYRAWVLPSGRIKLHLDGKIYTSPSAAGAAVRDGKDTNGWIFWNYQSKIGEWVKINTLLKK